MDSHKNQRKKLPLFLSINVRDETAAKPQLYEYIEKCLLFLISEESDNQELKDTLEKLKINYNFPQSLHITTLYIGKDHQKTQTDNYQEFQPKINCDLIVHGFAICVGKIITGICRKQDYDIKIENQYPHLTTLCGVWKPKQSNDLLESVFSQNPLLFDEFSTNKKDIAQKVSVTVEKEKVDCYLVSLKDKLLIKAQTKFN